jgi:protein-disulfide isomerase
MGRSYASICALSCAITVGCGAAAPVSDDGMQVVTATFASGGFETGARDAKVEIVEFGSYSCPYCEKFWDTSYAALDSLYIRLGVVKFRYVELSRNPHLQRIAAIAECNRKALGDDGAVRQAFRLAKDSVAYMAVGKNDSPCVTAALARIADDQERARALGVTRVPTFVIGKANSDGVTGWVLEDQDHDLILQTTERALKAVRN